MSDRAETASGSLGTAERARWVEVTRPLADAMRALAACVKGSAPALDGASIAVTERGTLVLNERAWELCRARMNGVPGLKSTLVDLDQLGPLRFLLVDRLT